MKKGIGPRGLGVSKQNMTANVKTVAKLSDPPEKKSKAELAATAAATRELQDKFRSASKDAITETKEIASSKSRSAKQFDGKGFTEFQKGVTVGRLRKNSNIRSNQIKENIKSDLRNLQSGKEELAYVGRPERYGKYATIKDKSYVTSKNKDGSYNTTRVKNIYNDFEGQGPKGAQLKPLAKRKR
jgi:hypothetical protein